MADGSRPGGLRTRPRVTITAKLVVLFSLLALLPTLFTVWTGMRVFSQRLESEMVQRSGLALESAQAILWRHLRMASDLARLLARQEVLRQSLHNPSEAWEVLERHRAMYFLSLIEAFGPDRGRVAEAYARRPGIEAHFTPQDHPMLRQTRDLVQEHDYVQGPGGLAIKAAVPVVEPATLRYLGAVVVTVPLDQHFLQAIKDETRTETTLALGRGRQVRSTLLDDEMHPLAESWPGMPDVDRLAAAGGSLRTVQRIQERVYAASYGLLRDNQGRPLAVLGMALNMRAMQDARATALRLILISAAVALALAVALGWFTALGLTSPIRSLQEAMTALARGDLARRVPVSSGPARDELTVLARGFNTMAEELQRYRNHLEEQVEERTGELVRSRERLQRYALELHESSEEVRRFAHIVSHDLRSPLVNLKGFAGELRMALEEMRRAVAPCLDNFPPEQRNVYEHAALEDVPEALAFIDASVKRMDGQLAALLKLSRLGRLELKHQWVDAESLARETLATLAHQLDARQGRAEVDPLPRAWADPVALEQIFGNMLANAVGYLTPDRPGLIQVGGEEDHAETRYWVQDNGRGIASQDRDKVFAVFQRAGGSADVPGEGMGLAYVQALVRRHGGRIWFRSREGRGTTFYVSLPKPASRDGRTEAPGAAEPGEEPAGAAPEA
jgi:hypothetical protein